MPSYTDYDIYNILNENGYKPSNGNLAIIKEDLESGSVVVGPDGNLMPAEDVGCFIKDEFRLYESEEGPLQEGKTVNGVRWRIAKFSLRFLKPDMIDKIIRHAYGDGSKQLSLSKKEKIKLIRELADKLPEDKKRAISNSEKAKEAEKGGLVTSGTCALGAGAIGALSVLGAALGGFLIIPGIGVTLAGAAVAGAPIGIHSANKRRTAEIADELSGTKDAIDDLDNKSADKPIAGKKASIGCIKEALINSGYKDTDANVFIAHDALQEGTLVITEEPTYDKTGDEIFVKDHKTKKLRSVASQKEHDDYVNTGSLMYRKNADGHIEQGVVGPDGKYRNVHGKYGDGESKIAYVERKDVNAAKKTAIGNLVGKKK